jgi:hypothetical protein
MAKKKHKKKHNFQHKNAPAAVAPVAHAGSGNKAKPSSMPNEWGEVRADVRRSLILSGIFIAAMIGLYFLLNNTSLGDSLYKSISL